MQKKRNMRGDPGNPDDDDGSLAVVRQLAQRDDYVMVHATELQELLAQFDELRDRVAALTHREEKRKW